ncbi:NACHT domain-containing protein [Lysinibacillus fusiformis]|uniref:NACHT domain-containing protein n=1 Tax=Lysinibacillus fusiformis TaxID=28031 RepID=UPI0008918587|nr:NACHT domain-containing protein [Lysinibacillus fusiformis]SCX63552.1 Trypsin [Lysinibacillus fusiformis]SDB46415.1 Trypsin [Lysinibacillus fusiformis]SFI73697.1 Trypsin [Lysinibacillus fusiformis]SFT16018.1 Trypsin [Lysinibacillus fusiformis]
MDFLNRTSIPRIKCGNLTSSGFLVSNDKVLTALHAIKSYLQKEVEVIEVTFINEQGLETTINAEPLLNIEEWEEYEIICLQLNEQIEGIEIIKCINYRFYSTTECVTYGYPAVAKEKGTSIDLEIRNEFKAVNINYGSNLDIKVKSDSIKDYRGCSGGPLLYNNQAVAVMLEQISEGPEASRLCAVSLYIYEDYLDSIGISLITKSHEPRYEEYISALKIRLQNHLENTLQRNIEKNSITPLGFSISVQSQEANREVISFNKILENNKSIMILSNPGGGKTYLLHMLMLEIIENPQLSIGKIPIYLKGKEWFRGYKNVIEAIRSELGYFSPDITEDQIIGHLKDGKYILLIDGLDEIANNKDLFIREIRRIAQFEKTKIIMTCRQQNYHNEFYKILTEYKLKALSENQIQEYIENVFEEKVHYGYIRELENQLKDLIENPLFLYMTTHIMKEMTNKVIPKNKSELYEVFVNYIMQERLLKDGSEKEMVFELDIKVEILMEYAYLNFREKNNSVNFRDVVVSRIQGLDDFNLIKKEILETGVLLEERNRLEFFHPSIEEYFVALKISRLPEVETLEFIRDYYMNENYYEVFKFTSGLLRNYKQQNLILDELEKKDIYLYRQCLESRFNFSNNSDEIWSKDYLEEYFAQMRKSYLIIINTFFKDIKRKFYPWCEDEEICNDEKVTFIGALDRVGLTLSIEIIKNDKDKNKIIVSEKAGSTTIEMQDNEGNIISTPIISFYSSNHWYFNLKQTDFGLDSAREVAYYVIKKQLKEMVEKQNLFEYESLNTLVPCIEYILKQLPKSYFSVGDKQISLYEHTNEEIVNVLLYGDNIFKYIQNLNNYGYLPSEYVSSLIYMLFEFYDKKIDLKEYLLLQSDIEPQGNSYWVWEVWSDEQLIKRLSQFFDVFQASYRTMVKNCFGTIKRYMPLYSMGPVRYTIGLERSNDGFGGGGISYSWIPVESISDASTIVKMGREKDFYNYGFFERARAELDLTLKKLGRVGLGGYSYSNSALDSYIGDDRELRNKVYRKIKNDLEYVLGSLD